MAREWAGQHTGGGRTGEVAARDGGRVEDAGVDGPGNPGEEVEHVLVVVRAQQEVVAHHVQLHGRLVSVTSGGDQNNEC